MQHANTKYGAFVLRGLGQWGDKWTDADLAQQFVPFLNSGERVKVTTTYGDGEEFTRTGTIGVTGGWRPVFLLMHRSNSVGSWDTLKATDKIVAVKRGRGYVAI